MSRLDEDQANMVTVVACLLAATAVKQAGNEAQKRQVSCGTGDFTSRRFPFGISFDKKLSLYMYLLEYCLDVHVNNGTITVDCIF